MRRGGAQSAGVVVNQTAFRDLMQGSIYPQSLDSPPIETAHPGSDPEDLRPYRDPSEEAGRLVSGRVTDPLAFGQVIDPAAFGQVEDPTASDQAADQSGAYHLQSPGRQLVPRRQRLRHR